ncbi:MAG: Hsp20/alpha crystallin family protein [Candidatus Thermoplasmatota archaeon]
MAFRRKKNDLSEREKGSKKDEITESRPTTSLWTDMDRLFNQFRHNLDNLFWNTPTSNLEECTLNRTPPVDVADQGDRYEMKIELPGIPKDDVNVEISPNGVEVSADREEKKEEKGKNWLRRERSSSSFHRCFDVPEELKTEDAEAEMKDGVLNLKLPKVKPKPKKEARKLEIK